MNKINMLNNVGAPVLAVGLVMTLALMSLPLFANAGTYAYVDTVGEVKQVSADTWQLAIARAPGIHIHSGVMLLDSPSDFDIVGDDVSGY